MAEFQSTPIERGKPRQMQKFKSHPDFIPVHRYPPQHEIGHGEIGMLMTPDGNIYKRLFYDSMTKKKESR